MAEYIEHRHGGTICYRPGCETPGHLREIAQLRASNAALEADRDNAWRRQVQLIEERDHARRREGGDQGMELVKKYGPTAIQIVSPEDGSVLLSIDLVAKTVSGELENANEAARVFVKFIRQRLFGGLRIDAHHYLAIPKRIDGVQIPTQFVCHTCGQPPVDCTGCGYEA